MKTSVEIFKPFERVKIFILLYLSLDSSALSCLRSVTSFFFFFYICWAFSSSTVSTSSFIWFLSSSSWASDSLCSSRSFPPKDVTSKGSTVAGFGFPSTVGTGGLWSNGDGDNIFTEGCREKKERGYIHAWLRLCGIRDIIIAQHWSQSLGWQFYPQVTDTE